MNRICIITVEWSNRRWGYYSSEYKSGVCPAQSPSVTSLVRKQNKLFLNLREYISFFCCVLLVLLYDLIQTLALRHLDSHYSFACCRPFNANGFYLLWAREPEDWGEGALARTSAVSEDAVCTSTSTAKHRSRPLPLPAHRRQTWARCGFCHCPRQAAPGRPVLSALPAWKASLRPVPG